MKRNHKNRFPFLILLLIHLAIFFFTIYKKGLRNTLQSLFPNVGMTYLFEYFVLNLFRAYVYYPKVFKEKHIDNIFGAILSQAFFVPITMTFLSLFKMGWKWKVGFTVYFFLIEQLFLRLGVYKHQWWKTVYTSSILPIAFKISDNWFHQLKEQNKIVTGLSMYLTFAVIHVNVLFYLAVSGVYRAGYKKFSWHEHFVVNGLYTLWSSVWYSLNGAKQSFLRSAVVLVILVINDFTLIKLRFIKVWKWGYTFLPLHLFILLLGRKVNNLYRMKEETLGS